MASSAGTATPSAVASASEQAPVFVDGRGIDTAFNTPVATTRHGAGLVVTAAAEAFTGVSLHTQLGHVVYIAQTAQALHLAVVRVARQHVIGEHVELAPLLQVHRGVGLADFQANVTRGLGFSFLEYAFGAAWQVPGAIHVGLGQAQADVAWGLVDQRVQAGLAARQVAAVHAGLGRQLLRIHPGVVGIADGQAFEFNPWLLAGGEAFGDFDRLCAPVAFLQCVEQRRGVFDPVIGFGVGRTQRLAV